MYGEAGLFAKSIGQMKSDIIGSLVVCKAIVVRITDVKP
jgi:hypothetical protein